jgi:hypothetical protein
LFMRGRRPRRGQRVFLGAGLLPIYWPAGPQSARHIRAGKAPLGRHIGSPHRCNTLFMRGRRPLQGQCVFLGGGLLPIYWPAGPQSVRPIRAAQAPEGRHIGSPHRCNALFMRGRRPRRGQRVFLGRRPATNRLARWATIRWAHACRTNPVTRGRRPRRGQRVFLTAGLLPIYWPAGPQSARHIRAAPTRRGDISVAKHRRASVFKAP